MAMSHLYLLLFCLILGLLLKKSKMFPENSAQTLGALILHVPLPALCLLTIPKIEWNVSLVHLGLVMWIVFGVGYFLFSFLGKKSSWPKEVVGCLILTAGLSNTAFIGFPVIEALWGEEALKNALFIDQVGIYYYPSSNSERCFLINKIFVTTSTEIT